MLLVDVGEASVEKSSLQIIIDAYAKQFGLHHLNLAFSQSIGIAKIPTHRISTKIITQERTLNTLLRLNECIMNQFVSPLDIHN